MCEINEKEPREEQREYEEDVFGTGKKVDDPENYRKPPYMREKTTEDETTEDETPNRYAFDEPVRARTTHRENQRAKKGRKTAMIIVLVALGVGAMVGGLCWSAGRLISKLDGGEHTQVIESSRAEAEEPTTAAAGQADSGAVLENPSQSVIPSAPSGEVASGSVLISDVPDVVDMCMPSIVAITTTYVYENYNIYGYNPFFGSYGSNGGSQTYETTGAGSGIIIGDDGEELWVVTNNHVVADSTEVKVGFNDGEVVTAYIKGTDTENDLAVVGLKLADMKESTRSSICAIQMGDSNSLRLGETVIAIGNALGIGQSVTTGIVSALDREITTSNSKNLKTIQTDAAINPGNSGGALLNNRGQLIGINVAKDVEENVEGMGYAIPISNAIDIIEKLTTMQPRTAVSDSEYPYLGVQLKDIDSSYAAAYNIPTGILVYTVESDGPADKAGMLTQDIITKFNDVEVSSYEDLKDELKYYAGGTQVTVTVSRIENGSYVEHVLNVTLGLKSEYTTSAAAEEGTDGSDGTDSQNGNGFGGFGGFGNGNGRSGNNGRSSNGSSNGFSFLP